MKRILVITALALAACHAPTTSTATSTGTATGPGKITQLSTDSASKPGEAPGGNASEAGGKPDDNYSLVGRWGDDGDCSHGTTFNADGTFSSDTTGGGGQWTLEGNTLTMSGKANEVHVTLQWLDADHTRVTNADGSVGNSQRCPSD